MMNIKCQYSTVCGAAGSACFLCGLITIAFWWEFYNGIVLKHLPLSNNSETFRLWTGTDVPMYISVYLFNLTNAAATIDNGEKPALQQVGPYVYRLEMYKKDFVWNDNDTLTYTTGQRFFYSPELSRGNSAEDFVTIPNLLLVGMKHKLKTSPPASRIIFESVSWKSDEVHPSDVYVTKTVAELLFDGYDDPLLTTLNQMRKSLDSVKNLSSSTQEIVTLSDAPFMNKVSGIVSMILSPFQKASEYFATSVDEARLMYKELNEVPKRFPGLVSINDTRENTLNIYTGNTNLKKFGLVNACSYRREYPARGTGPCGRIARSSLGDFWPVDITKGESASLFVPDLCSALRLKNIGRYVINGIEGIRFESTETTFDEEGSTLNCPSGDCSCQSSSGVRNLSTCLNVPLIASMPHFYGADSSFQNAVQGLKPDRDLHAFHVTLQKEYGVLLHGSIRLQLSVHLLNVTICCGSVKRLPDVVLPILWFETDINLPTAVANKLHFAFAIVPLVFKVAGRLLFVLGLLILMFKKYFFS